MVELAAEAYKAASDVYGMNDAEAWGAGFTIPADSVAKDCTDYLACGGSLESLAGLRRREAGSNRLSSFRAPIADILSGDS